MHHELDSTACWRGWIVSGVGDKLHDSKDANRAASEISGNGVISPPGVSERPCPLGGGRKTPSSTVQPPNLFRAASCPEETSAAQPPFPVRRSDCAASGSDRPTTPDVRPPRGTGRNRAAAVPAPSGGGPSSRSLIKEDRNRQSVSGRSGEEYNTYQNMYSTRSTRCRKSLV
jgi:hypothetical protein